MIIIDENFPESQRLLLINRRIKFKQIGIDIGRMGLPDEEIISFLLKYKNPTFCTLDSDFFRKKLSHSKYCLLFLEVGQYESAAFIRRFLKHNDFSTQKKRMGKVIKISHSGIKVWKYNAMKMEKHLW